jgi:hypothetical protein
MLTRKQLMERERSLRGTKVLSVYVTAWWDDPARREAWRIELKNALEQKRDDLRLASHAEREAYDACVRHLRSRLDAAAGISGEPGWIAFVTDEGMQYEEAVPVALPTRVDWGEGIQVAPYIRLLKQGVPAVAAVVDARQARVYGYRGGRLERLDTLRAHKHMEPPQHMGGAPRPGFHTGTRGSTGADETDRAHLAGRDAMLSDLAERLVLEAGPDGWILVGGIPEVVDAAVRALPDAVRSRARRLEGVDVHASDVQVAVAAEQGATRASRERDGGFVQEILNLAGAHGKGLTGWEGVLEALRERAVNRLCFTDRFLREHPVEVEQAVALALDQDAEVEHVSGAGAERLDAEAGGVGARLRFAPGREQAPVVSAIG